MDVSSHPDINNIPNINAPPLLDVSNYHQHRGDGTEIGDNIEGRPNDGFGGIGSYNNLNDVSSLNLLQPPGRLQSSHTNNISQFTNNANVTTFHEDMSFNADNNANSNKNNGEPPEISFTK